MLAECIDWNPFIQSNGCLLEVRRASNVKHETSEAPECFEQQKKWWRMSAIQTFSSFASIQTVGLGGSDFVCLVL